MRSKAAVSLTVDDILDLFEMTEEVAEEWLHNNRRGVENAMAKAGVEAIEELGALDGLKQQGGGK